MIQKVNLHVGSIAEMGKRFIGAWHQLERGETVSETNLTFFSLETMRMAFAPLTIASKHQYRFQAD